MNRSKEDTLKTKEALIDAAYELFRTKGYENTTLSQIVAQAGLSRGAAYWHYKNKDALYETVIRNTLIKMYEQKRAIVDTTHCPLLNKVSQFLFLPLDNLSDYRMITYASDLIKEFPQFEQLTEAINEAKKKLYNLIYDLLHDAQKSGEFPKEKDLTTTANIIYFLFQGLYFDYVDNRNITRTSIEDISRQVLFS